MQQQQPTVIETLPQTQLSQSPDLLRHIPPTAVPASSRSVSSDQLPRRARNTVSSSGAVPTISCPYYKSELYIVSEEQAFRSQQGRPFRNDDVADCIAVASSTPPSLRVPHRSCLRTPDVTVGRLVHRSNVDSQPSDFVMRHSYSGSASASSSSDALTSSVPVTASASSLPTVQYNWPSSRQSVTESKWKWLHSNAMMPEQQSPISLRRAKQLDIPSTTSQLSTSPLRQDLRQQSAGSLTSPLSRRHNEGRLADIQDQTHASRLYRSKPVVDSSASTEEQPQRRKTTMDLMQSVYDVHRSSVDDKSIRHWRHSSDNTARHSTADPSSIKRDSYGLTLSLSGAAVPRSNQTSVSDIKKSAVDLGTNGRAAAASAGDLPHRLPIERIMRFEESGVVLDHIAYPPSSSQHPKDTASVQPSQLVSEGIALSASRNEAQAKPDLASAKHPAASENAGRSGRLSVPDSIPIYFRAEPSVTETKVGPSDSKTAPYSSHSASSCGMYILAVLVLVMMQYCTCMCVFIYK